MFVVGLLLALFSFIPLLPLQFINSPAEDVGERKTRTSKDTSRRIVIAALLLAYLAASYWLVHAMLIIRVLWFVAVAVAGLWISRKALAAREFIRSKVISTLLLPAVEIVNTPVMTSTGRKVKAMVAITEIRRAVFVNQAALSEMAGSESDLTSHTPSVNLLVGESKPPPNASSSRRLQRDVWFNVLLSGDDGVAIDAAFWLNPMQQAVPARQAWILFFLANAAVYEFGFEEYAALGNEIGANVFVFNYRGVSHSRGTIIKCSDLVDDGLLCLNYLTTHLGAKHENILFFGRSIGGGVAAVLRARHSPSGPILSDRSFSSIGDAATSVVKLAMTSFLDVKFGLPKFIVQGIGSAIVKFDLDAVTEWPLITGLKLILYHTDDAIINYDIASLHKALETKYGSGYGESIRLETTKQIQDAHNVPLRDFPQYPFIVLQCQGMVCTALPLTDA